MRQQPLSYDLSYIPGCILYDQVQARSEYTDPPPILPAKIHSPERTPPILYIARASHPARENVRQTSPAFRLAAARASAKLHIVVGRAYALPSSTLSLCVASWIWVARTVSSLWSCKKSVLFKDRSTSSPTSKESKDNSCILCVE